MFHWVLLSNSHKFTRYRKKNVHIWVFAHESPCLARETHHPTGCSTEVTEVLPAAAAALSRVENQVPRGVALSKSWSLNQQRKEFNSIVTIGDGKCPKMSLKFSYITQLSSIGDMSSETQIRFTRQIWFHIYSIYMHLSTFSVTNGDQPLLRCWNDMKLPYWLVVWNIFYFFIYCECHHPNQRTYIFQRGRYTTKQLSFPTSLASSAKVREVVCRCCAEPVMRILKDYPEMPVGSPGATVAIVVGWFGGTILRNPHKYCVLHRLTV